MSSAKLRTEPLTSKFEQLIIETQPHLNEELSFNGLLILDLHPSWCGPCKPIRAIFRQLYAKFAGRIRFLSMDADKLPPLIVHGDKSEPTFVLIKMGRILEVMNGIDVTRLNKVVPMYIEKTDFTDVPEHSSIWRAPDGEDETYKFIGGSTGKKPQEAVKASRANGRRISLLGDTVLPPRKDALKLETDELLDVTKRVAEHVEKIDSTDVVHTRSSRRNSKAANNPSLTVIVSEPDPTTISTTVSAGALNRFRRASSVIDNPAAMAAALAQYSPRPSVDGKLSEAEESDSESDSSEGSEQ
eukprot:GILK01004154.1.p1 GENE.GILK01004154.1~~GILK01004154.1.p1  ORF type:complete len:300 (+),score=56.28 GILK01004154.1:64-963(+)